jgi:hypothetical protein
VKKQANAELLAEELENNRLWIDELCTRFEAGRPLGPDLRADLAQIIRETLAGIDPRKALGIKHKNGTPASMAGVHSWLSLHYWALRLTEPKEKDLSARKIVARLWRVSESRVYQVALPRKTEMQRVLGATNRQTVLRRAEYIAAHPRKAHDHHWSKIDW